MALRGAKNHIKRLRKLSGAAMERAAGAVLQAGGEAIRAEARRSITTGSISGKGHVASLPGAIPKNDTGVLAAHIREYRTKALEMEVRSEAPYAAALEFGSSRMAARPYLRVARDKLAPELERNMKRQVQKLVKASGAKI